jgi:predicted acetyltransferase
MDLEIRPAGEADQPVIQEMSSLYVYDISEFTGWDCADSGRYGCRSFHEYRAEPACHPFLVKVDGKLAGFALINDQGAFPETQHNVGEFFVLRKWRRRGIGERVARFVFDRFRGGWEVMQLVANTPPDVTPRRRSSSRTSASR